MNVNKLLRLKALQTSLGRIMGNYVFASLNEQSRGIRKTAPIYTHGEPSMRNFEKSATYEKMIKIENEIKEMQKNAKHVGTIINRINAKRKELNNLYSTRNPRTSLITHNYFKKEQKLSDELRRLHDQLLLGVRVLNKIKARKAAAGARGRNIGLAAKKTFNYRLPAPEIGNFGGINYRKTKRNFNLLAGKIANAGTSPRRNSSPKSVSPKRGMKHAGV